MNTPMIAESELMVNGLQIRAARGWLGWSQQQLADASKVAKRTIVRIEQNDPEASTQARTLIDVQRTLERAGIEFLFDERGGVGIVARRS